MNGHPRARVLAAMDPTSLLCKHTWPDRDVAMPRTDSSRMTKKAWGRGDPSPNRLPGRSCRRRRLGNTRPKEEAATRNSTGTCLSRTPAPHPSARVGIIPCRTPFRSSATNNVFPPRGKKAAMEKALRDKKLQETLHQELNFSSYHAL